MRNDLNEQMTYVWNGSMAKGWADNVPRDGGPF